jgi:hypothetical protein
LLKAAGIAKDKIFFVSWFNIFLQPNKPCMLFHFYK